MKVAVLLTYIFLQRFREHGCHVATFSIRDIDAFCPSNELAVIDSLLSEKHPQLGECEISAPGSLRAGVRELRL